MTELWSLRVQAAHPGYSIPGRWYCRVYKTPPIFLKNRGEVELSHGPGESSTSLPRLIEKLNLSQTAKLLNRILRYIPFCLSAYLLKISMLYITRTSRATGTPVARLVRVMGAAYCRE